MRASPGRAGQKPELQLGTAHACARTRGAVIPEGSSRIRLCSHTLAVISSHHKSPIVARMVRSCGRCVIPKGLRRRCSGCRQEWAKRKAVWLGESGVDVRLLSLLHQNFDGWVGLLNRWNDWKKLQKSEWDRADSLARFVLPHPTGRRGLSGLQRAPTRRSGTPSAPLLRSGAIVRAPLRQAVGPEGTPVSVHVPFTACDLLNCKQSDPIETIQKECIVLLVTTPSPNWGDVQALLEYLFTTEERRRILEKAREGLIQQCRVKEYQKLILYGIQHGVQKPNNLSKLSEVRQGDKETPSAFSERLCEVARKRTDLDPEDDSNSKLFNTLFIGQAAADIRKR
ncbi:LOW QUALITY PROTEIN: hypothetical protein QYF61_002973 [Mycteria americana]|uniref:Core shell protein Gag P30 domain-containing protein n=1 Tax=Mycteria americana TaxID=33587 RepID=A0AAN7NE94_MYCAM|nr:LOW QUALITY PROTEIN: hypothetical protein QYF61_002966 [Mycteria americana]KAK4823497.1 LOW QUALITY PROTEIN: hypothetical protein QYF61_002973 [Mycteria americana]